MAACEYDLDTSGGLMEEIQRLVAPPESETQTKRRRIRDREYFRRPGKAHNHDSCDSCKEGGDLVCCDQCPASFHLQCHDPPLDDEDVPPGEWLCHRCRTRPKIDDDDTASTCSSRSRQSEHSQPSTSQSGANTRRATAGVQPAPSPAPSRGNGEVFDSIQDMELAIEELEQENPSPLAVLAHAAKYINPKQFELPKDSTCSINFPGSSKRRWWGKDRNVTKKMAHEKDNGLVPLPAKLCFKCNKSCRVGPLVQCDYCPLLFHLDCLDPPLTSLPTGRWMCPNHAEHVLDEKLLSSVQVTDRVKLWDKYTGPVNQHAVKVNFFNKCHRQHPPFRWKVKHSRQKTIQVPEAVKCQYRYAPPLMPRPGDTSSASSLSTSEEQEQWLSSVVSLQSSIANRLTQREPSNTEVPIPTTDTPPAAHTNKPTASVLPVCKTSDSIESLPDNKDCNKIVVNGEVASMESDDSFPLCVNGAGDTLFSNSDSLVNKPTAVVSSLNQSSRQQVAAPVGFKGRGLTPAVLHSDSSKVRTSSVGCIQNNKKSSGSINNAALVSLTNALQASADSDLDISQLDDQLVRLLAYQRLQQLQDSKGLLNSKGAEKESLKAAVKSCDDGVVRARAVLCPLSSSGQQLPMTYRSLHVGTGPNMDLCLSEFGTCNFVSSKHACIFYDEMSRQYELLNYSEHGTTVDNVLYSCDFSEKISNSPPPSHVVGQVRKVIKKGRERKVAIEEENKSGCGEDNKGLMSASAKQQAGQWCGCRTSSSSLIPGTGAGWEGTALLHHGSLIRMGCIQFVFSIVEAAPNEPRELTQSFLKTSLHS